MVDLNRVKLYTQSWYDGTEYDDLIEDIIKNAESYINELIGWRYVPKSYTFKSIYTIERDGKIYLDKLPVKEIISVEIDGENFEKLEIDFKSGIIKLKNCYLDCRNLKQNAIVEYKVGGYTDEYPIAIDNIILDLVLKKLNFAINNAQGFKSMKIGNDINLNFMFELTQEQKYTVNKYAC